MRSNLWLVDTSSEAINETGGFQQLTATQGDLTSNDFYNGGYADGAADQLKADNAVTYADWKTWKTVAIVAGSVLAVAGISAGVYAVMKIAKKKKADKKTDVVVD